MRPGKQGNAQECEKRTVFSSLGYEKCDFQAGSGNKNILLTERGSSFGYNTLVTDMGLAVMRELGYPVVMDATHSVQIPGGKEPAAAVRASMYHMARAAVQPVSTRCFWRCMTIL